MSHDPSARNPARLQPDEETQFPLLSNEPADNASSRKRKAAAQELDNMVSDDSSRKLQQRAQPEVSANEQQRLSKELRRACIDADADKVSAMLNTHPWLHSIAWTGHRCATLSEIRMAQNRTRAKRMLQLNHGRSFVEVTVCSDRVLIALGLSPLEPVRPLFQLQL